MRISPIAIGLICASSVWRRFWAESGPFFKFRAVDLKSRVENSTVSKLTQLIPIQLNGKWNAGGIVCGFQVQSAPKFRRVNPALANTNFVQLKQSLLESCRTLHYWRIKTFYWHKLETSLVLCGCVGAVGLALLHLYIVCMAELYRPLQNLRSSSISR